MYCKNCGRYIYEDGKDICSECLAIKAVEGNSYPTKYVGKSTDSFTPTPVESKSACGIISAISGQISFILWLISLPFVSYSVHYRNDTFTLLFAITWILIDVGIILGIIAIRHFSRAKRYNCKKPVADLVTGIVGLCWSVLTLVLQLILTAIML